MKAILINRLNVFLWLAWPALIFGLFGLRGVIPSSFFADLFNTQYVLLLLRPLYYLSIALSLAVFILYAVERRSRFVSLVQTLRQNAFLIGANLIVALPFMYLITTKRLHLDFWLDELISIRRHIVTTMDRALFWYPVPNNHVFINALSGIYLQLLGAKDLLHVLQTPEILRIFYLLFSLAAVAVAAFTAHRFIGRYASIIIVILWTTTIAFLNFAAQVRGYAPSLLFVSVLLLAILQYKNRPTLATGAVILVFCTLLLYTMPSNLYLLGGLLIYFGLAGLLALRSSPGKISLKRDDIYVLNPALSICILIVLGCLLAVVFYLPILHDVLDNKYIVTIGFLQGTAFTHSFIEVFSAFGSNRWLVFGLALAGLLTGIFISTKRRKEILASSVFLGSSILLPFLLSMARGDDPPPRTFLFCMPAFFLLATLGLHNLFTAISKSGKKWIEIALIFMLFVYATAAFFLYYGNISTLIRQVLVTENVDFVEYRDERLAASVYLDRYSVRDVINEFSDRADPAIPVLIDGNNTRYDFALTTYLETYEIEYETVSNMASITEPRVYFFLSYPEKSLGELRVIFPVARCTIVTPTLSVYRAVECTLR